MARKHLYRVDANGYYLVVAETEQEAKTKYRTDAVRGGEFPASCTEYAEIEIDDEALSDEQCLNLFFANADIEAQEIPDFDGVVEEREHSTDYRLQRAIKGMNEREKRDLLQMIEKLKRAWKA